MQDSIVCEPLHFTSRDGHSHINACIWHDSENEAPVGIVQIVHGMAEHIARYDDFARWLVSHGYIVCGHDQIGHGDSCPPDRWGKLPAREGKSYLISDVDRLRLLTTERFGNELPYFLFGHSLGSYITRAYITRHGDGLAGAIICGTGYVSPAVSKLGNGLARFLTFTNDEDTCSDLLEKMGVGAYAAQIQNPETDVDWLSYNKDNVQRYIADERCGFRFSIGGYAVVTSLTGEVCSAESVEKIPKTLPLLYIAGCDDPVGSCGKGVRKSAEMAEKAGVADVRIKIYDHMRHEILNETGHELVYGDILAWLEEHRLD